MENTGRDAHTGALLLLSAAAWRRVQPLAPIVTGLSVRNRSQPVPVGGARRVEPSPTRQLRATLVGGVPRPDTGRGKQGNHMRIWKYLKDRGVVY
jgi:hypothetical protein